MYTKYYFFILISFATNLYSKAPYHLDRAQLRQELANKQSKLLWHQWFPSVGLSTNTHCISYINVPRIPAYSLTLHELAPNKGRGVRVAFIDTGVAAFPNKGMPYHPDIVLQPEVLGWKTNIIGQSTDSAPTVSCYESYLAYIAGHGTHTMGIVAANGDITGFAPQATNFMIKACHDNGTTTIHNLIKALETAIFYKADIVNISLKINSGYLDQKSKETIETLFSKISYVVIPAGNESENILAMLKGVAFAVGAFDYDLVSKKCTIPDFAQYSPQAKPLVLAPGVDILSTGLAPRKQEGVYVVADGTSAAAACITGFLALLLGELGMGYDKKIIMRLIKESSFFLEDTSYWRNASTWGVIDMRRVLSRAKNMETKKHEQNRTIKEDC